LICSSRSFVWDAKKKAHICATTAAGFWIFLNLIIAFATNQSGYLRAKEIARKENAQNARTKNFPGFISRSPTKKKH
jgi:hypothetical protein